MKGRKPLYARSAEPAGLPVPIGPGAVAAGLGILSPAPAAAVEERAPHRQGHNHRERPGFRQQGAVLPVRTLHGELCHLLPGLGGLGFHSAKPGVLCGVGEQGYRSHRKHQGHQNGGCVPHPFSFHWNR